MAKYLKVTNRGSVPREFWEIIGATTKDQSESDSIGFKGSGAKFAVIPALRLGLGLTIASSDNDGLYQLNYFTQKTPLGFDQIYLNYNNGEVVKPTNFAMSSLVDWDKPIGDDRIKSFKLLREVIVNAYDADKNFSASGVQEIAPPEEGLTNVYIGWSPEFNALFGNTQRYFKFRVGIAPLITLATPTNKILKLYPCSDEENIRIFINDVLAYCRRGRAVFDYSIACKDLLSEERTIKDFHAVLAQIYDAINLVDDEEHVKTLINSLIGENCFEREAIRSMLKDLPPPQYAPTHLQKVWFNAWQEICGKYALLGNPDDFVGRLLSHFRYQLVNLGDKYLMLFLKNHGCPTAIDMYTRLSRTEEVPITSCAHSEQETLKQAIIILKKVYPNKVCLPPIFLFKQEIDNRLGFTELSKKANVRIGLNIKILKDGLMATLQTLAHEYRHVTSQAHDFEIKFNNEADLVIADLLMQKHCLKKRLKEVSKKKG